MVKWWGFLLSFMVGGHMICACCLKVGLQKKDSLSLSLG